MKRIIYSKQASKTLARIPANEAQRIRAKIAQYAEEPAAFANNVKRLRESAYLRLRIGDWRVIFSEDGVVVDVVRIAARGEAYDGEIG